MRESVERERDAERERREHVTHLMSWEIKKRVGNFSKSSIVFLFFGGQEARDTSNAMGNKEAGRKFLKSQYPSIFTVQSHCIEEGARDTSNVMRNQEVGGKFLKKKVLYTVNILRH
jgi:hypothetical protein